MPHYTYVIDAEVKLWSGSEYTSEFDTTKLILHRYLKNGSRTHMGSVRLGSFTSEEFNNIEELFNKLWKEENE